MKKISFIFVIIFVIFIGLYGYNSYSNTEKVNSNKELYENKKLKQATVDQLENKDYQYVISPEEAIDVIKSSKVNFVYFYSPTCSHCKNATPKVNKVLSEKNLEINQYNLLEYQKGWQEFNINGTPTLIAFKNGIEIDRLEGDADVKAFRTFITSVIDNKENKE